MTLNWADQRPPLRLDVLCLIIALALHAPLLFQKYDFKGRYHDRKKLDRLVSVDLIEPEALIKPAVVTPPPPVKTGKSLFERLKALVKKEPPPPKPVEPKVEPKKLDLAPKEIKLEPKLNVPAPESAKLEGKKGFETKADPKLVQAQKLALNAGGAGLVPLTAQKLGVVNQGPKIKTGKNDFQVSKNEKLSGIGSAAGPKIEAAGAEPAIAIRTGNKGTVEKFAQAPQPKKDKGKLEGGALAGPGNLPQAGTLRDKIIARDAPINQIGNTGGSQSRFSNSGSQGDSGSATSKKEFAKKFDENRYAGGSALKNEPANPAVAPIVAPIRPVKKKKEMFEIIGPLKDRAIEKKIVPEYPQWAQSQGIQATVVLEFTVDRDGKVKENIVVVRTSGYPKLDQEAILALEQWKWVALPEDVFRSEVGQITFNFQLE